MPTKSNNSKDVFPEDISEKDKEVHKIVNQLRKDPNSFIKHLEDFLKRFEGNSKIYKNLSGDRISTNEGKAAIKEAINVLQST